MPKASKEPSLRIQQYWHLTLDFQHLVPREIDELCKPLSLRYVLQQPQPTKTI